MVAEPLASLNQEDAYRDSLTGLATRDLFHEHLRKEIAHLRRGRGLLGIALLDLDDFQTINATLGPEFGDQLLVKVARRLAANVRESDTLARYGDDEFAVLLTRGRHDLDLSHAATRLAAALRRPFRLGSERVSITGCLGLGTVAADEASCDELLSRAASALSRAKKNGPGVVEIFDAPVRGRLQERLRTAEELRQALPRNELCVHYQPQVDLTTGVIRGAEGLIRWRHPQRGLVEAGQFIPLAEQIGIMPELGGWLLRELCRQSAQWQRLGGPVLPVSVNVSIRQFQAGGLVPAIEEALAANDLDPAFLNLEITESIALHDVGRMIATLQRIRDLGVKIQLDDFGTGYSSLSYLLKFPVDVIKIDGSFVAGLVENPTSRAIVQATLALAASLGLEVIAEGVESDMQLRSLVKLGCRAGQGYRFARPLPPDEFEALVGRGPIPLGPV